jgi:hypothetical protein
LKIDPKTKRKYLIIGRKKYWVKDSVSKKKLGDFVNQKLKKLGYKTKKLRYRRTFKQAQAKELYPEAPRKAKAGPKVTSKRPFPFQKKATEQEIEELQKRREPENIEMFQLTKDALLDLARREELKGRSAMTKAQLITALRNKPIETVTPEELKAVAEAPLPPVLPRTEEEKANKADMIREYLRLSQQPFVPAKFKRGRNQLKALSNETIGALTLELQKHLSDIRTMLDRQEREEAKRKQEQERLREVENKFNETREMIERQVPIFRENKDIAERVLLQGIRNRVGVIRLRKEEA